MLACNWGIFFKSNIDKVYKYIRYQESQILRVSMKIRRENKKGKKEKTQPGNKMRRGEKKRVEKKGTELNRWFFMGYYIGT